MGFIHWGFTLHYWTFPDSCKCRNQEVSRIAEGNPIKIKSAWEKKMVNISWICHYKIKNSKKQINNHLIWKSSRSMCHKVRGPSPSTTMGVILTFIGKGEREFLNNQRILIFSLNLSVSLQWKWGQRKPTQENTHQNSFAPNMQGKT